MPKFFKVVKEITKETFIGLSKHNLMTHAAAIAFYTIFSLPGLLITIVTVAGIFVGQDAVRGELASQIDGLVGTSVAAIVQNILKNIELTQSTWVGTAIGIGTLLFSATTVFMSLQASLNEIWEVKSKPKRGFLKYIINRMISLGMVVSLGFIFMITLLSDMLVSAFVDNLEAALGSSFTSLIIVLSSIFSALIIFIIIGLIFIMLPDVKLQWKNVVLGALITTGLFIFGKFLIGLYLSYSDFSVTYEAAGSLILILVWVYYSTVIILLGAEVTRSIMNWKGETIKVKAEAIQLPNS